MYKIDFFNERYDSNMAKIVKPKYHGDYFSANSHKNIVFGDYLTAVAYGFQSSDQVVIDHKANHYGTYLNAEWAQTFAGDTIAASTGSPVWDGQKGKDIVDIVKGKNVKQTNSTEEYVTDRIKRLFNHNKLAVQMRTDLFTLPLTDNEIKDAQLKRVCNGKLKRVCNANPRSYIPLHTLSNYSDTIEAVTQLQFSVADTAPVESDNSSYGSYLRAPTSRPVEVSNWSLE